ncbi:MAG TPA: hypothetical protein VGR28_12745 [Candidatus Thermoplasmatota archaeon]|nr:hypothetical protein [Candidatus Thermoplasmatota archaeon]
MVPAFWLGVLGQLLLAGLGGAAGHASLASAVTCDPFDGLLALPSCATCFLQGPWEACAMLPTHPRGAVLRLAWPDAGSGVWVRIAPSMSLGT